MNIQRGITAETRSEPARLVVVEDDAIVAEDIRQTLEGLGYEVVHTCPRGEWVMEAAREYEPDLVLMDIRLAGEMDGIEAGDTLQRQLDVPVVYLTAYADEDTLERARRSAPYGYVVKPFSEQGLQTAVEVALVRHEMQQRLRESEKRFRQMARAIEEVFYLWDYTSEPPQLLYVSPAYEEIWGRQVESLYEDPTRWKNAILDEDVGPIASERTHRREKPAVTEYRIQRLDGEIRWIQDQAFPVREGPDDEISRVCGVARDVTARKQFEDELEHRALHDHLTGLPNRALFRDRLNHALDRSERTDELVAIFFLDLKRFKVVNDSLGHAAGDRLLEEVARRLSQTVRAQDTVARVGGDEFTVLLEEIGGQEEAIAVARRIVEILGEPVALDARDVTVDASIGIAFHRAGEDTTSGPSDLVRWADDAMYRAKERPGTHFVIADRAGDAPMTVRLDREARLRTALQEGSIPTVYQPVYELGSGSLYGVEALARWRDAELGTVSPEVFVPLAEETGLIVQLWEQQMERACRLMLERPFAEGQAGEPLQLHVNLSAHQLDDPDLVDRTRRILDATGFPAERLSLEVTESAAMGKPRVLDQLHGLGVALAIDDFGTRYSTLAQLRRLNIDALKIDRTFIAGLLEAEKDRAIVDTVLTLGQSLDLSVIAEGIESEDQLALLRELGCDRAQGFLLARPMEADELRETVGPS